MMLISKMQMYLMEPEKSTFTLGSQKTTISSSFAHKSAEINAKVEQVAKNASRQIEYKVSNASKLITGAKGGYVVLDCGDDAKSQPSQILIMDTPDKATAKSVIRINKNGIGFSTTGYNGIYRNAWTIDGNLVADFITTGTMLADRIMGGTLTMGGYDNKNGVIQIKDSDGIVRITLDVDGINVNDNFKVDMSGNIEAVSISGDAIQQISDIIDNSAAMKKAKQAIQLAQSAAEKANSAASAAAEAASLAQSAANKAQETANTANSAAATANSAASAAASAAATAQSAAETANETANIAKTTVDNLVNTIIPQINASIQSVSDRVAKLENK